MDLSLAALQGFDPGLRQGVEQRFCCPLPGCAEKTRTKAHRSLSVNTRTGEWHCHRCGAGGILEEFRTPTSREQSFLSPRARSRNAALRAFTGAQRPVQVSGVPGVPMTPKRPLERLVSDSWRRVLSGLAAYPGSPAAAYLTGRGIGEMFPCCCGVKYHPRWYGYGPAVVFPIRDQADVLVAAQGRYLDPAATPKARTAGPVKRGVFQTPGALGQEAVLITEAPIDALSLAICGFPAVALIGTHFPDWLPAACRGKRVLIATDADEAGDQAAERLCYAVAQCGLRAERLKPIGAKDWNEVLLTLGREALATALTNAVKRR